MYSRRNRNSGELPEWSVKKQKAYKISRILWIAQMLLALIASIVIATLALRL